MGFGRFALLVTMLKNITLKLDLMQSLPELLITFKSSFLVWMGLLCQ